ncbi:MAG: class I SAM-dependent DNA methyltransferase [Caldilineaceae bacterium]
MSNATTRETERTNKRPRQASLPLPPAPTNGALTPAIKADESAKEQTNETLRNDMWRACDILRRDNNVGGIMQYTEHLAWLLFLKFLDEEEKRRKDEADFAGESYHPVLLGTQLAWDAWASAEKLAKTEANDLITYVRGRLLPGLAVMTGSPLARTIAKIFSEETVGDNPNPVRNMPVCASGYNLKDVLAIINSIRLHSDQDIHTISQFYEDLLERMGGENKSAGEFYTPRPVIRFMVETMAPQIGETVYDPACGSAGFLVEAFQYMRQQERTTADHDQLQHATFFGREKKGISALLGTMNMVLHDVATPNIDRGNTLEESMKGSVSGRHDVILTNPPFGGTEGRHIQQNFAIRGNATELLFLQHILKKLKRSANGRAAVVVPEGTLFRGGAFADVKKELLEQFHLFAVVSLPPGTFAPYSDVKTAPFFFQRPDHVLSRNPAGAEETWYYEVPLPVTSRSSARAVALPTATLPRRVNSGRAGRPISTAKAHAPSRWPPTCARPGTRTTATTAPNRPNPTTVGSRRWPISRTAIST